MRAYITSLAYSLGTKTPASELEPKHGIEHDSGIGAEGTRSFYCRSQKSVSELAAASMEASLMAWLQHSNAKIGMVIFCTESDPEGGGPGQEFISSCQRLGLENVVLLGLRFNYCGNLANALMLARSLVHNDAFSAIMIVTADRAINNERSVPMGLGLLSDGAASMIVTKSRPKNGFEMLGFGYRSNLNMLNFGSVSKPMQFMKGMLKGVSEAVRDATDNPALLGNVPKYLIGPSIHRSSLEFIAHVCKFDLENVYMENVSQKGHVFAADPIINIVDSKEWREGLGVSRGTPFLCISMSSYGWGAFVVSEL